MTLLAAMADDPSPTEHADPATNLQLEEAVCDPIRVHEEALPDQENPLCLSKEQSVEAVDRTSIEIEGGDDEKAASKEVVELNTKSTEANLASSNVDPTELDRHVVTASSLSRPFGVRPQYQLVFGMDDNNSEASLTSSPRSLDMNSLVTNYLSQHHYLPGPLTTTSQSHDLEVKSGDLKSLSHDLNTESHDHDKTVEDMDGSGLQRKVSATSTPDDVSSVYSSSTIQAGSVSGQSTKPTSSKKEREGVSTPDSEIKLEDIKLRSVSPNSSRDTPPLQPKVHALNVLTSDSEAGESPPYSPVPYLSGE